MKILLFAAISLVFLSFALETTTHAIPISYGLQYNAPLHLVGFFPWPGAFVSQIGFRFWIEDIGLGMWIELRESNQLNAYFFQATWRVYSSSLWTFDGSLGVSVILNPFELDGLVSGEILFHPFRFLDVGPNLWIRARPAGATIGVGASFYYVTNLIPREREAE